METLGYAFFGLVWGAPVVAILVVGGVCVAVVRWRKRAIAAMEAEDRESG
ncbi:hypothetical protein ACFQ61_05050 [Streptomyces sp. NPDC056500]